MHAIQPGSVFDVALVGCGPVGITLAGLLGREGLRVVVFERSREVYAQPRAVGFDHDAMRLFQRIGAAPALAPHITDFRDTVYRGVDGQVIQRVQRIAPPYPYTWAPNYTCDQPGVEAVLRQVVGTLPAVQLQPGTELLALQQHADGVALQLSDDQGRQLHCSARWVVGCDGASSTVRRLAGLTLHSHDYDEPWIVVDLKVGSAALARLPDTNVQYCEPGRPCTYIVCPGNHRRWEFMLMDGEPREGALEPARLWSLLARWLQPGDAELWRAAAYRFHALVGEDWRAGRVLLAGDSAHQTPPFMGQGLCQGLRDAGNLAWKLAAVLRGRAGPALLDSYTTERRPHVEATTLMARQLGLMLSERDPQRARMRDAQLLARAGGQPPTLIRQDLIPPLRHGLIAPGAPRAGEVLPQPRVRHGARTLLMDDLLGPVWRLVVVSGDDAALTACARAAAVHGLPLVVVGAPTGPLPEGALQVQEDADLLRHWLAEAGLFGALVRPDHHVYGGFASPAGADALLRHRAEALPPPVAAHEDARIDAREGAHTITHEGDIPHGTAHTA